MRKALNLCVLLISFTLILPSCVSKKKWTELMGQKDQIDKTLSETQQQVANLEGDIENLNSEKDQLALDYKTDKENMSKKIDKVESDLGMVKKENEKISVSLDESNARYKAILKSIHDEFAANTPEGYSIMTEGKKLYVKGGSAIQFRSGSARLKKDSKEMLKSVAEMLKSNAATMLMVEGHTDNLPMKEGAKYASNMELSIARANSVVRALVKMGVNKSQLLSSGMGESKPMVSYDGGGDQEEARKANRRADLALMVSPGAFYGLGSTM